MPEFHDLNSPHLWRSRGSRKAQELQDELMMIFAPESLEMIHVIDRSGWLGRVKMKAPTDDQS